METDWDNLLTEIEKGCCAIFLGHGLLCDDNGTTMHSKFCDDLARENRAQIHAYYPEENFFLFTAKHHQRKFANQLGDYYNRSLHPDKDLYRMLAEIPVSLYISISPDNYLEKAIGETAQVSFFGDPRSKAMEIEASRERPLIYQIMGSFRDSNSILLSHDGLFKFFKSVLGEKDLPNTIKKFFGEDGAGGEVIFLGFSFKKWYVQLLLRLFNLSADNQLSRTAYLNTMLPEDDKDFAVQQFQVKFIETEIKAFITTLHQKCKERGLLRKLSNSKEAAVSILAEDKEQRISQVKSLLQNKRKLRTEYEDKQTLADDPREIMRYDKEIKELATEIEELHTELKSYTL